MSSGNTKRRKTARKNRSKNTYVVSNKQTRLVTRQKQEEIRNLINDLADKGIITSILNSNVIKNSVRLHVRTAEKFIKLRFVIWEQEREKDRDYTDSQFAKFVLRPNENINDIRARVLRYIEGIDKGFFVERLYGLALERQEHKRGIRSFHKTGKAEDIRKKDFKIYVLKDGRIAELVLQVKSSERALRAEEQSLRKAGIAGSYYDETTGDLEKDIDNVEIKIEEIVRVFREEDKLSYI